MSREQTRKGSPKLAREAVETAEQALPEGRHEEGRAAAMLALQLTTGAGQPGLRVRALYLLAMHEFRLGRCELAVNHGLEALSKMKGARHAPDRIRLSCALVMAYNELGLYPEAMALVEKAMEWAKQVQDGSLMSWVFNRAGTTCKRMGAHRRAERFLLEALKAAREAGGTEEKFSALNNLTTNLLSEARSLDPHIDPQQMAKAREYALEGLALAQASGNGFRQAVISGNLAIVLARLGDFEGAIAHNEQKQRLCEARGDSLLLVGAVAERAHIERWHGNLARARDAYLRALANAEQLEDHGILTDIHEGLHLCFKEMGEFDKALFHHEQLYRLEREDMDQRLALQSRLAEQRMAVELVEAEAARAKLDAEVQRLRATHLENENALLALRTAELSRHAMEDQLTGLANRRRMDHELPRRLEESRKRQTPLCIAVLDLDHFKKINDTFGHATGDDVLRRVAQVLIESTRSTDIVARMGGEEFVVVLDGMGLEAARVVCERLRRTVQSQAWDTVADGLRVTVSIGVCQTVSEMEVRDALECADTALYEAKHAGRNRVEVGIA